jgi:NADPH2:quinone reductase
MRAIVVDRWLEARDLRVSEIPAPQLRPGALELEVKAAGCNFFDILMVQGKYQVKPPFPFVPGAEVAGVVRAVGEGVTGFAPGDRVLASAGLGGFAELAVVPAAGAWAMPEGMSFAEGAALPIIYPTSYAALVFRAKLQPKETLLVHAAAGGVGIAAVQIGKALGARVIATAGGQLTGGKGADVIYDSVGGDTFDKSLKCIAWNGRLLVIGFASGRIPEVKANRVLLKNISIVGLHWGAHVQHEPARIPETFRALFELYRAGKIKPVIFETYPLEQVALALEALGSRKTWGKVIVAP